METEQVLGRALEVLDECGWIQCSYESADGVCIAKACYIAVDELVGWGNGKILYAETLSAIAQQTGCGNVARWNDTKGRTYGQVKEVLRRAGAEAHGKSRVALQAA